MRDVHRRDLELALQMLDLTARYLAQFGIQIRKRLVHQEYARMPDDRPRQSRALTLAARKPARLPIEKGSKPFNWVRFVILGQTTAQQSLRLRNSVQRLFLILHLMANRTLARLSTSGISPRHPQNGETQKTLDLNKLFYECTYFGIEKPGN